MRGACFLTAALLAAAPAHLAWAGGEPEERYSTLEDLYGDTGNTFQAAIGFINFQGTPSVQAQTSYGLAVDDVVLKWRESTLIPDATSCASNFSCAVLDLGTQNAFEGQTVLEITLIESTPDSLNDCDLDGAPDGTNDCNGNAVPDLVVSSTSTAELGGEISYLDRVGPGGVEYKGTLAISSFGDGPGTLFVSQQGTELPVVTATYRDNDVDPGAAVEPCPSHVDPSQSGVVQDQLNVVLGPTCEVQVVRAEITQDNGDHDAYADTLETVDMRICAMNQCGFALHDCSARIWSESPEVDCILKSVADFGDLTDERAIVCGAGTFRWKVADVDRTAVDEVLQATFGVSMVCDEIDALSSIQTVSVALDLDLNSGGQASIPWTEGFESGALGGTKFFAENLDAGMPGANNTEGLANADGWRCQYSDPDWPNSNSYGDNEALWCYPGATLAASNKIYWQVDGIDTGSPTGGRARSGSYSGYYGQYLTTPAGAFTTPTADVESIATTAPINLAVPGPGLSWYHQISLVDSRLLNAPVRTPLSSAGRGVVQVKTVDTAGSDTSVWTTLQPYKNSYDSQAFDNFFNCLFDPVDDGTTEDDFFDPTDPERRLGPSSTCYPEFTFSCLGDTNDSFQADNICNATAGPGVQGTLGTGTWVESRVDLSALAGRRIKLRFLSTNMKGGTFETYDAWFPVINMSGAAETDNGWWIDDVEIDATFPDPATFVADVDVVRHAPGICPSAA